MKRMTINIPMIVTTIMMKIELYQGNSKRSTQWHSTPEQRTPPKQSFRLWWGAADQCTINVTWYLHPCYDIGNPELYGRLAITGTDQSHKSNDPPVTYATIYRSDQKCAHFCSDWCVVGKVHCGICELVLFSLKYVYWFPCMCFHECVVVVYRLYSQYIFTIFWVNNNIFISMRCFLSMSSDPNR